MSAKMIVTGYLGHDPELRYIQSGTPILDLRVAATYREKDKNTGEWSNAGEDLWIRATFWDRDAQLLAETLTKGSRITLEGILVRNIFERRDGGQGEALELRYPKFLGVIPPKQGSYATQDATGQAQTSYGTPNTPTPMGGAQNDPWGKDAFNQEPPF